MVVLYSLDNSLRSTLVSSSSDERQVIDVNSPVPNAKQIQQMFAEIESGLPFREGDAYKGMLTFNDNLEEPIHRWYSYKEGYSCRLVDHIIKQYPLPARYPVILDPFAGAGTTLLVAQDHGLPSIGIELNPFAAFLSRVKSEWYKIDPEQLEKVLVKVLKNGSAIVSELPLLSTFHNEKYFPNRHAYELVHLRDTVHKCRATPEIKNALLIALAATIEDVSCLHKDGRLLRYYPREVISPREALYRHTMDMIKDLRDFSSKERTFATTVLQGDSRDLVSLLGVNTLPQKFGLILYSPPYLNNFDYSEVYKCELWLLGMIKSYEEWQRLRQTTFRSHPSCRFPQTHYLRDTPTLSEVFELVEQIANCPNIGGYAQEQAPRIIRGYFDDVVKMLQGQLVKLATGGHIVCVVGNSKHGELHIPTDTLIAKIGQDLGLELIEIYVAKYRNNRKLKNSKLRESLVVFRKS